MTLSLLVFSFARPCAASGQEVQVIVPGKLVNSPNLDREKDLPALISCGVAQYSLQFEERFVEVKASLPLEVFRKGDTGLKLFKDPVYLISNEIPPFVRLLVLSNSFHLDAVETGKGNLNFSYRTPLTVSGNQILATVPLLNVPAGHATVQTKLSNLEFQHATLWKKMTEAEITRYELGVAGGEPLVIAWTGGSVKPRRAQARKWLAACRTIDFMASASPRASN